jgi:hypothetical protein
MREGTIGRVVCALVMAMVPSSGYAGATWSLAKCKAAAVQRPVRPLQVRLRRAFQPGFDRAEPQRLVYSVRSATEPLDRLRIAERDHPAGGYYLVQQSCGSLGQNLPMTPDATGALSMSATTAKSRS